MADRIDSYQDLVVWQKSMDVAVATYSLTRTWPKEELYGLTSQARRAASSVPANIAEGYGRDSTASYQQFLRIAQPSTTELETHLHLAQRIGLTSPEAVTPILSLTEAVGKMLRQLIKRLTPT